MKGHFALRFLIGWVILLGILYSTVSIVRHNHFESGGFDLGIYDQAVWQYSQFLAPYNTIKERFILGDHLTLTLPLLVPLYWFWSDGRMLLIFQAFWLSFSSIAMYHLALLRLIKLKWPRLCCQWLAVGLGIAYSLFPGIQYAVVFDFHPVIIGVGLLPWLGYLIESKRRVSMWIAVVLLLLTQENMGLALAGLGLIYIFQKSFWKEALAFIFVGLLASYVAMKGTAFFSPIGFEYTPVLPKSFGDFVTQLFDDPDKRQVWMSSFGWYSFLPLLSPGAILATLLDLSQYFTTGPALRRMWSPYTHHRAILGLFLVLGTLEGVTIIRKIVKNISLSNIPIGKNEKNIFSGIIIALLLNAFVQQYIFHYPLNKLTKREYWKEEAWMRDNRELLRFVPADAAVAAQQDLVPHLSHRKEIYLAWPKLHENRWWLDFAGKPEYLVVDTRPNQWLTQILESNEHLQEAIDNMENDKKITLQNKVGAARIYRVSYNKDGYVD